MINNALSPGIFGKSPYGTPNDGGLIEVDVTKINNWAEALQGRSSEAMIAHVITHEAGHCIRLTRIFVDDQLYVHHSDLLSNCVMFNLVNDASVSVNDFCQDCKNNMRLH